MGDELQVIAARQHGTFSWRQASRQLSRAKIRTRFGRGEWVRVFRRVYREATTAPTPALLVAAAGLSIGRPVVAVSHTEAALHGFGYAGDGCTHVAVPGDLAVPCRPGLRVHVPRLDRGLMQLGAQPFMFGVYPSAMLLRGSAATRVTVFRVGAALLVLSLALTAASLVIAVLVPPPFPRAYDDLRFYLDVINEGNLPSWWSSGLLLAAALLHAIAGALGRSARAPAANCWFVTAALLLALSLDDYTALHERMDKLGRLIAPPGAFPFYWVVPGALAGLVIAALLVLLAVRTRGRTRPLLVVGGVVLLASALGGEYLQGTLWARGLVGTPHLLAYHVEEFGENVGAVLLLAAAATAMTITRSSATLSLRYRDTAVAGRHRAGQGDQASYL